MVFTTLRVFDAFFPSNAPPGIKLPLACQLNPMAIKIIDVASGNPKGNWQRGKNTCPLSGRSRVRATFVHEFGCLV